MVYLYLWMIVAANGTSNYPEHGSKHYGWVNSGEYRSFESCNHGANLLGMKDNVYRCVPK